jgi:hypothetical protein
MCKSTKNGALGAFPVERLTFPLMAGLVLHGKGAYLELEVGTLTRHRLNPCPPVVRWLYAGAFLCVGILWRNWGWYIILGELEGWMERVWAPPPRYIKTATLPRCVQGKEEGSEVIIYTWHPQAERIKFQIKSCSI